MKLFNKSIKIFDNIIYIILFIIFLILSIGSLIATGAMTIPEPCVQYETVMYHFDNIFINLFFLVLIFILLKSNKINLDKLNIKLLGFISLFVPLVIGLFWIFLANAEPVYDQLMIYQYAQTFNAGDFSFLQTPYHYFEQCPNQYTMLFFFQGLIKLVGSNLKVLQIINLLSTLVTFFFLERITEQLFHNDKATKIAMILVTFCIPPILFSTFIYGTMLGLMFSVIAFSLLINYLQSRKNGLLIPIVILLALSYLAKVNNVISIIAVIMVLISDTINKKNLYSLFASLLLVISIPLTNNSVYSYYEKNSGVEVKDVVSFYALLSTGFQEGDFGPGWWNTYQGDNYILCESDKTCQNELAKITLKEQLDNFINHPSYFVNFISRKMMSAWGDPSYQTLHISQPIYPSTNPLLDSFYRWKIHDAIFLLGDIFQIVLYASFAISCLFLFNRKQSTVHFLIPLTIFGSFVYYFFFEIKGIYLIPIIVLLIPYSAYALSQISLIMKQPKPKNYCSIFLKENYRHESI